MRVQAAAKEAHAEGRLHAVGPGSRPRTQRMLQRQGSLKACHMRSRQRAAGRAGNGRTRRRLRSSSQPKRPRNLPYAAACAGRRRSSDSVVVAGKAGEKVGVGREG